MIGSEEGKDEIDDDYEIPNDDDESDDEDDIEDSFDFNKKVDEIKKNAQKAKEEAAAKQDDIEDEYSEDLEQHSSSKNGRAIDQLQGLDSDTEKYSDIEDDKEGDEFSPNEEI